MLVDNLECAIHPYGIQNDNMQLRALDSSKLTTCNNREYNNFSIYETLRWDKQNQVEFSKKLRYSDATRLLDLIIDNANI